MLEHVQVGLIGLLALGMQTGSFDHWRRDSSVTENGQQSVPVHHFVFSGVPVVGVLIHNCGEDLVDVDIVNVLQKVSHNASLLFTVDAICD